MTATQGRGNATLDPQFKILGENRSQTNCGNMYN